MGLIAKWKRVCQLEDRIIEIAHTEQQKENTLERKAKTGCWDLQHYN